MGNVIWPEICFIYITPLDCNHSKLQVFYVLLKAVSVVLWFITMAAIKSQPILLCFESQATEKIPFHTAASEFSLIWAHQY